MKTLPTMTSKLTPYEAAQLDIITSKLKRNMKRGKTALNVDELAAVKNLADGFHMFGYEKSDRVRLRDRVDIYNKIVNAMKMKLEEFRSKHWHMPAKELQSRLDLLKKEYEIFFREDEELRRRDEEANLIKALKIEEHRHKERCDKIHHNLDRVKKQRRMEQQQMHEAQTIDLENKIKRMPKPRLRMSTRMLSMTHGEKHLARLGQYKPAQDLRNMINKLRPKERRAFEKEYETRLENMRQSLKKTQDFDRNRLREALDGIEWSETRKANQMEKDLRQRLKNNTYDMEHAHKLQKHIKPQKTIKPVVEKRPNYTQTSSYFRGKQMLARLVGKREHAIPSLCDLHDFMDEPEGITYYHKPKSIN